MKHIDMTLLPHHLGYMEQTVDRGVANATHPVWLFAFALYNMENQIKLNVDYQENYKSVFKFIENKMK